LDTPLLSGFVWVDGSRVVGNLSLMPSRHADSKLFLIANVAVHPDYRRQGIARALTEAALNEVRLRGRRQTWLQVDVRNPAAIALYKSMGFVERLQRSSWRLIPDHRLEVNSRPEIVTRAQRAADWSAQQRWLKASYPAETRWQLPLDVKLLQPGWRGALERAFAERQVRQWSAERGGKLLGVLTWQSSTLEADRFWLALAEGEEDAAIPALTRAALDELRVRRPVALNYPAGRAGNALQKAGFTASRTLIWMSYPWK
jgi:predicted GNAT family acetyltransferase